MGVTCQLYSLRAGSHTLAWVAPAMPQPGPFYPLPPAVQMYPGHWTMQPALLEDMQCLLS